MTILESHEIFEIEVLEKLKNAKFLEPLVFGGGTMLRLCYELNRYSVDLDFWFLQEIDIAAHFEKLRQCLKKEYDLTDARIKFNTLLFEIRSRNYPRRLKIEIRKKALEGCDFQEKIAFSKYFTKQVVLKVHTLDQTMKNKVEAALDRSAVRDFFDIEFLLRRGCELKASKTQLIKLRSRIDKFKMRDYKVVLGSLLESEARNYYAKNGFSFLSGKISSMLT